MKKMVVAWLLVIAATAHADCVLNAKQATNFQVLDNHTILLSGGIAGQILIKSFAFFHPSSRVTVLKDNFCDFESSVLYVDGETVDAQQVKQVR
ncbi:hypothetical protein F4827_002545 [Paraburkholderia bannensis]|uniref:Uncharacterized protein n=1 Tax=Paraburkholderia bannensis TaxID=765414 RepID=A0A7W9TWH4_9BURK|nr:MULTISPECIES: hypothetical protein [Paraburkholderia]MBB3257680.1 hypothetical protein [Paraburkholderia sp. WP4_3_2]MBB6102693.1 hypothetical protein [Paraburkholderia bannensis]